MRKILKGIIHCEASIHFPAIFFKRLLQQGDIFSSRKVQRRHSQKIHGIQNLFFFRICKSGNPCIQCLPHAGDIALETIRLHTEYRHAGLFFNQLCDTDRIKTDDMRNR